MLLEQLQTAHARSATINMRTSGQLYMATSLTQQTAQSTANAMVGNRGRSIHRDTVKNRIRERGIH